MNKLYLLINLGGDRYALDIHGIEEVLPMVELSPVAGAPPSLAGIFNYRGEPVGAIDLSQLALGRPARQCLSTRVIVVRVSDGSGGSRLLGAIAEGATGTVRLDANAFRESGVAGANPLRDGSVLMDSLGMIQRANFDGLLQPAVGEELSRLQAVSS